MKLGIIGTAGRGPDGDKLKVSDWNMMCFVAMGLYYGLKVDGLVSGGAAWADHVAVRLYMQGITNNLSLHLPAPFDENGFVGTDKQFDTGRTSNFYHLKFSKAIGIDSLGDLKHVLKCGAKSTVGSDFKSRNTLVAKESDCLLAFTFGEGPILKDGGTKDTMDKFLKRKAALNFQHKEDDLNGKIHGHNPFRAFHFDLNTKKLFEI